MNTAWKFLRFDGTTVTSNHDDSPWVVGEWRGIPAPNRSCVGLCASKHAVDAYAFVAGEVIGLVECGGKILDGDKLTCQRMRLLKVWPEAEYEKVRGLAWAEYEKARGPAWAEYEKAVDEGLLSTEPMFAIPEEDAR